MPNEIPLTRYRRKRPLSLSLETRQQVNSTAGRLISVCIIVNHSHQLPAWQTYDRQGIAVHPLTPFQGDVYSEHEVLLSQAQVRKSSVPASSSLVFFNHMLSRLILLGASLLLAPVASAAEYALKYSHKGQTFFEGFEFAPGYDNTTK